MFLFDMEKRTFEMLGESEERTCKSCNNTRKFKYVEERSWVSIFNMAIAPYKKRKLLICPVCSIGFKVSDDIKIEQVSKRLSKEELEVAKKTKYQIIKDKFNSGEISKNEFIRMNNLLKFEIKTKL